MSTRRGIETPLPTSPARKTSYNTNQETGRPPEITAEQLPEITDKQLPEITDKQLPEITAKQLPEITAKQLPEITAKQLPESKAEQAREDRQIREKSPYQSRTLYYRRIRSYRGFDKEEDGNACNRANRPQEIHFQDLVRPEDRRHTDLVGTL
ncbi:hypothetical protein VTN49DRAFT_4720 [Thermomyces lanuginosus]|uniref:uncharacterized protein n=1 Tax=Thermomyces lanuginosus TaxID=5541 RepID=UPI0037427473